MSIFIGRRKEYTEEGIKRVPCVRCGQPSLHQWQSCANDYRFVPICMQCDIDLNALVLEFMNHPHRDRVMAIYKDKWLAFLPQTSS